MSEIINKSEKLLNLWSESNERRAPALAREILTTALELLKTENLDKVDNNLLHRHLEETSYPVFLQNLSYPEENWKWAESCFALIQKLDYSW